MRYAILILLSVVAAAQTGVRVSGSARVSGNAVVGSGAPIVSINASPRSITTTPANTVQFSAVAVLADGSQITVTNACLWVSSSTSVATIAVGGLATGVASGTSNITCVIGSITSSPVSVITVSNPPIITAPVCASQPCVLPSGNNGNSYSFTATASGGTLPYTWSFSVGSLASCGVSLNSSTGTISGTATTCSNVTATLQATDSSGGANPPATVQVQLTINSTSCGPPNFLCSTSNVANAIPLPGTPPFTGLTGSGTINSSPEPGNPGGVDNSPIYRLTDVNTPFVNSSKTMVANRSGAGFNLTWSCLNATGCSSGSNYWLYTADSGDNGFMWNCVTGPFSCSLQYKMQGTGVPSQPSFSTVTNNRFYYTTNASGKAGTQITYQDPSDATHVSHLLFDFATCPSWPSSVAISSTDPSLPNYGDLLFGEGYSATGIQDTGRVVAAYVAPGGFVASGCYYLNLQTTAMYGPSGLIGNYNASHGTFKIHQVATARGNAVLIQTGGGADTFTLTNIAISGTCPACTVTGTYSALTDGTQLIVGESVVISGTTNYNNSGIAVSILTANSTTVTWSPTACVGCGTETAGKAAVQTDRGGDPWLWIPGDTDIHPNCIPANDDCSGHWTPANLNHITNYNTGFFSVKPFSSPGTISYSFPINPNPCANSTIDTHPTLNPSWTDSQFILTGSWTANADYTKPCMFEILAFLSSATTLNVKRFGHLYVDKTWEFGTQVGITAWSQDGKYAAYSSNMNSSLGSITGATSCTAGTVANGKVNGTGGNCRADVFILDATGQ